MLRTLEIGPYVCKVCYLTVSDKSYSITVECPKEKLAFRFDNTEKNLKVDDWICITGKARVDMSKPEPPYYHAPPNDDRWIFRELSEVSFMRVGPPECVSVLIEARSNISNHINDWFGNLKLDSLERTASSLKEALKLIEREIDDKKTVVSDLL